MPRKRHHIQSLKPFSVTSPAQASAPDRPPASVNERLANLRRAASVGSGASSAVAPAAPSLPPAIREVLQLPEVPAPLPRRRPARQRFDHEGRRLPAGPAPPRSWLSRGSDVRSQLPLPSPAGSASLGQDRTGLPGVYYPASGSLVDLALRRLARDWEIHGVYSRHLLYYLPDHLKPALMRCLGTTGPGVTIADLKAMLLPPPPDGEEDDDDSLLRRFSCLELSSSTGRSLTLRSLSRVLFPRMEPEPETVQDSNDDWDEAPLVLRQLSRRLYRLEYLDLTGCGPWFGALKTESGHDSVDWVLAWGRLDIEGLSITVSSAPPAKGKTKARAQGIDILSSADLRLKAGRRYGLVGRNGTGKSKDTKIALLQQTRLSDGEDGGNAEASVLRCVIDKATSRDTTEQEIQETPSTLHTLRSLRHHRLQARLSILDKEARLRSGARGLQARKALVAHEKVVAESEALLGRSCEGMTEEAVRAEMDEAADLLSQLQLQVEPSRMERMQGRARALLAGLGFSDERMGRALGSMSGGWHMRASLATTLLLEADILLLDEPTNFLDMTGIIWLQRYLLSLPNPPTIITVSHDRVFTTSLCTDLLILKDQKLNTFTGSLPAYESSQSEQALSLTRTLAAHHRQRAHMEKTIRQNIKAGRANDDGNKLRQAKSRQKKLDDRWGVQVNARGGRFKLNRDLGGFHLKAREEVEVPVGERAVVVRLPLPGELRFPGSLVSLEGVSFAYGSSPPTIHDINLTINMGDRIAILGPNGTGKSTLTTLLTATHPPQTGTSTTHPRLIQAHYTQHAIESLLTLSHTNPALTALSLLALDVNDALDEAQMRALLGELGLPGRVAEVPLGKLSGGQLVRCELARLLWRGPQCLLLDEVTTHLDYETVCALRDALAGWEGAVVVVSHDRWFVRGVVEGVDLVGEEEEDEREMLRRRVTYRLKEGRLVVLEGGVDEFEALMEKRAEKLLREYQESI
ncbi:hypothetical protein CDD80_2148 [Ophiocordyceps camponoti-rufipedis]|uniref:ABC transporter domain-containing protein n=1 Tax=Ophiocordyceps camponoti-rufipedis TaxID=2004952 RepID=A0A2C5Z3Y4_9HYPO|nr:hypothetical protein CDD80_2148 [Ophiocordyceps camponoti-rufipedis]